MYCRKYRATIPKSTCIARQRRSLSGTFGSEIDPGCAHCSQGREVLAAEKTIAVVYRRCIQCKQQKTLSNFYGQGRICRTCFALNQKVKRSLMKNSQKIEKASQPKKQKEAPPEKLGKSVLEDPVVWVDFKDYPALFEQLRNTAHDQFRDPAQQVLFILSRELGKEAA